MKSPALLRLAASFAVIIFLAGCAASPVASRAAWEAKHKTRAAVTPFWHNFPPKAKGFHNIPNQTLARNAPVRFLETRRGFAKVQLETLEIGWVPKGTLKRN